MSRTINILKMYFQNTGFRWILGFVCVSGILSRILFSMHEFLFAEEFFTLLFVMVLWLVFHMGILLKHQFSNFRASLLPGYRRAHVVVFLCIYISLIATALFWQSGMPLRLPWMSSQAMIGSLSVCLMISLFVILLGYLSMGRFLLYGYCALLVISVFSMEIVDIFEKQIWYNYVPLGVWIVGLVLFLARLFALKEENLEYGHLLMWPPRNMGRSYQYHRKGFLSRFQTERTIQQKFPKENGLFDRLRHWDHIEGNTPSILASLFWVVIAMYTLVFFKVDWAVEWLDKVAGLFLMYVLTPLVILAVFYYKRLIFWGYETLRPVQKEAYFKDQAAVVFLHLFVYWLFTVLALAVVPKILFHIGAAFSLEQILFFVLSGSFVFLIAAVFSVLSAIDSVARIIINGGMLCCLSIIFFDIVSELNIAGLLVCVWACLASGLIFIKHGYHAWCNKEYV